MYKDIKSNEMKIGSFVQFYDSQMAMKDKDHSGDPKYFPIGKVINIYEQESKVYDCIHILCDIEIDGRVSKGHFIYGVEVI